MSTRPDTITALLDALGATGPLSARAMFGEYALYLGDRVVALICDDRLFIKPTPGALALMPGATMAPPYPGAMPHIAADEALDDPEPVMQALRAVLADLPPAKPKKRKGAAP